MNCKPVRINYRNVHVTFTDAYGDCGEKKNRKWLSLIDSATCGFYSLIE